MNLDLNSVLRYCRISRAFAAICQDPSFWRQRIRHDFPEDNLTNVPLGESCNYYLRRVAGEMQARAGQLMFIGPQNDPRYQELERQANTQTDEIARLMTNLREWETRRCELIDLPPPQP